MRIIVGLTAAAVAVATAVGPASAWRPGDTPAAVVVSGPATGLDEPTGVVHHDGSLFVADSGAPSVTEFAADTPGGDIAPVRRLSGPTTGLTHPSAVAFDSADRMYVVNTAGTYSSVVVYDDGWADGDTAPLKTLTGPSTGLNESLGVALDSQDRMYVTNAYSDSVTVYASGWADGDTAPVRTLTGPRTRLRDPYGIALDGAGRMFVSNYDDTVTVHPVDWTSPDTAPLRRLGGVRTGLSYPTGLGFDNEGRLNVANYNVASVTTYARGFASGDTAPVKTLRGPATGLGAPLGVTFAPDGRMFVANLSSASITGYPATRSQRLTVTAPRSGRPGRTVTLTASATSGLPVGLTSLSPAVCRTSPGLRVALRAPGLCRLRLRQAGNAAYDPAPPLTRSLPVYGAAPTVSLRAIRGSVLRVGIRPCAANWWAWVERAKDGRWRPVTRLRVGRPGCTALKNLGKGRYRVTVAAQNYRRAASSATVRLRR